MAGEVDLGRTAYEAYRRAIGGSGHAAGRIPAYDEQQNAMKAAWHLVARAVQQEIVVEARQAHRDGVASGRAEREAELLDAQVLHAEAGPTDYEVWRDACTLAATQPYVSGVEVSRMTLLANAEWWWENLQEVPVQKRDLVAEEPDCPGCGADSSMDHAKDCPAMDLAAVLTNHESVAFCEDCGNAGACDDNCPRADEDDDAAFLEREAERKAQEAFEDGFGTYPGHDMSVTTGGCGPEHPCPACRQRIAQSEPS